MGLFSEDDMEGMIIDPPEVRASMLKKMITVTDQLVDDSAIDLGCLVHEIKETK